MGSRWGEGLRESSMRHLSSARRCLGQSRKPRPRHDKPQTYLLESDGEPASVHGRREPERGESLGLVRGNPGGR